MGCTKENLLNSILDELKDENESSLNDILRYVLDTKNSSGHKNLAHITREEIYEEFATEKLLNKAPGTKKDYRSVILNGLLELHPNINSKNLFRYLGSKESWAPATKNRNYRLIKIFIKFLYEKGYIMQNLAELIEVPEKVKKKQYVPTDDDIKKFFSVMPKIFKNKYDLLKYQTFFKIYLKLGLRRDEGINIGFDDVDLVGEKIHLKETKNGDEVDIEMDDELRDLLEVYIKKLEITHGPLITGKRGKRLQRSVVYKVFHRIREEAELPKGFTIHGFRRYFADKLRREGVDIHILKELMRHKDINTTHGYVNVKAEEKKNAIRKIKFDF